MRYNVVMVVYIEYVILDNFILTFTIAILSYRVCLMKVKKIRSLLASCCGTAVAICYPYFSNNILLNSVRIILLIVLGIILFARTGRMLRGTVSFLVITFLFGGVVFAINYIYLGNLEKALTQNVFPVPLSIVMFGTMMSVIIVTKCSHKLHKLQDVKNVLKKFSVTLLGKKIELLGMIDTGNRLYDQKSGLPVVIVGLKSLLPYLSDEQLTAITIGKGDSIDGAHYITVNTISGNSKKMLLLPAENFMLYSDSDKHIFNEVVIGIAISTMKDIVEYDAILHPAICA